MSKCHLCPMRIGRVLSEEERKALLNGDLIVPDREVCSYKEAKACIRKSYGQNNGQ